MFDCLSVCVRVRANSRSSTCNFDETWLAGYTLCSEKNTHSYFLLYLDELFVDLNKNCSEYTQGLTNSDNVKIRYSM